jgi:hypothetical protein
MRLSAFKSPLFCPSSWVGCTLSCYAQFGQFTNVHLPQLWHRSFCHNSGKCHICFNRWADEHYIYFSGHCHNRCRQVVQHLPQIGHCRFELRYYQVGLAISDKKLFRGRQNRRNKWLIPTEFRLFRGTENSQNSVPNYSVWCGHEINFAKKETNGDCLSRMFIITTISFP